MDLAGKAALVTGGGTGIGRATTLLLAGRGVDVAINYSKSEKEANETAEAVRQLGRKAVAIKADVAQLDQVENLVSESVKALGRLDILINNAGWTEFIDFKNLDDVTDEVWDRTIGINAKGPFFCTRAAARHMKEGGVVVNVSSMAATMARGSSIPYCASKAALNIVTRAMARVLAPSIRVNAVAPGAVTTRWMDNRAAFVRAAEMQTPMRRVATAEDVAQVILALIADSDFVNGQILGVDGGIGA